jgi:hypothetical protein
MSARHDEFQPEGVGGCSRERSDGEGEALGEDVLGFVAEEGAGFGEVDAGGGAFGEFAGDVHGVEGAGGEVGALGVDGAEEEASGIVVGEVAGLAVVFADHADGVGVAGQPADAGGDDAGFGAVGVDLAHGFGKDLGRAVGVGGGGAIADPADAVFPPAGDLDGARQGDARNVVALGGFEEVEDGDDVGGDLVAEEFEPFHGGGEVDDGVDAGHGAIHEVGVGDGAEDLVGEVGVGDHVKAADLVAGGVEGFADGAADVA